MIDPQLVGEMLDTVLIERPTAMDGYGKQTYAAATAHQCRVEGSTTYVRSLDASTLVPIGLVYLAVVDPTIDVRCRLTLPDGSQPPIYQVNLMSDERGPYAQTIATLK